ncbi:MAG: LLM class F420-dependent oxidoreductase [Actinobacteria bacterium]|nr:LLM class F420-dependent oxidoreductase [Actinomycetota bacterium]
MRIGITVMVTDTLTASIGPGELAREVEAHGFDGLYVPEHTHIPTSRATPAPMGEPLPEHYRHLLDPFVTLTAAAEATDRIRIGTGICLVAERDPIVTAKEVASLDVLSGGRFVFGIGFGWNVEEMADHGVPFGDRREVTRERVLAMRSLWQDDEAAFEGEHVRVSPSWAWPKPVRSPLPVWLGAGLSERNLAHLVEYADGWIPIGGSGLSRGIPRLRAALEDAGRDPDAFEIVPFGSTPEVGKLEHFRSIGCTGVVLGAPTGDRDALLAFLERAGAVIEEADL